MTRKIIVVPWIVSTSLYGLRREDVLVRLRELHAHQQRHGPPAAKKTSAVTM